MVHTCTRQQTSVCIISFLFFDIRLPFQLSLLFESLLPSPNSRSFNHWRSTVPLLPVQLNFKMPKHENQKDLHHGFPGWEEAMSNQIVATVTGIRMILTPLSFHLIIPGLMQMKRNVEWKPRKRRARKTGSMQQPGVGMEDTNRRRWKNQEEVLSCWYWLWLERGKAPWLQKYAPHICLPFSSLPFTFSASWCVEGLLDYSHVIVSDLWRHCLLHVVFLSEFNMQRDGVSSLWSLVPLYLKSQTIELVRFLSIVLLRMTIFMYCLLNLRNIILPLLALFVVKIGYD